MGNKVDTMAAHIETAKKTRVLNCSGRKLKEVWLIKRIQCTSFYLHTVCVRVSQLIMFLNYYKVSKQSKNIIYRVY